jgi:hypothetical protein
MHLERFERRLKRLEKRLLAYFRELIHVEFLSPLEGKTVTDEKRRAMHRDWVTLVENIPEVPTGMVFGVVSMIIKEMTASLKEATSILSGNVQSLSRGLENITSHVRSLAVVFEKSRNASVRGLESIASVVQKLVPVVGSVCADLRRFHRDYPQRAADARRTKAARQNQPVADRIREYQTLADENRRRGIHPIYRGIAEKVLSDFTNAARDLPPVDSSDYNTRRILSDFVKSNGVPSLRSIQRRVATVFKPFDI